MKKHLNRIILSYCVLQLSIITVSGKTITSVSSPDGQLTFKLTSKRSELYMKVFFNNKTVIEESPISVSVDGSGITASLFNTSVNKFTATEAYDWYGLQSDVRNRYNGVRIDLKDKMKKVFSALEIKVSDGAAAFRFIIPGEENLTRKPDEGTTFRLPSGSLVWYHDLYMHYEGIHVKKNLDTIPAGQWAAPPLTFKLPGDGGYASITEADLLGYPGMALQTDGRNGFILRLGHSHPASYPYVLRYSKEDVERLSQIANIKGTITTPWRVIIVGKDLNSLVTSNAISDLCPPPDKRLFPEGIKTGWIKPGRAVWRYLDGGGDQTLKNMKEFSRMASELGFEYNILEGFWSRWPEDSIKALVNYSAGLGIGIIVWKHSKDLRDPLSRQQFFQRLNGLGIAGIKIDFFDHEAKEVIDLYESIFRETAAMKLLLILHGSNKPTGLSRTWPNVMIYEGVKGMEASKLTDRATHETTIPFTRMIAGPADYSVCHFGTRRQNTTWVHQVATAAIYSAPVITYAASPSNILSNPCAEIIKSIPAVWDETKVLTPSEIGELAVFVQRKGSTWFLSIINGLDERILEIPLLFLGNGEYKTYSLSDSPMDPASAIVSEGTASSNNVLKIRLTPGGGYITRFTLK